MQYSKKTPDDANRANAPVRRRTLPTDFDFQKLDPGAVDFLHHLYAPYCQTPGLFVEIRCLAGKGAYGPREWFETNPPGLLLAAYQMHKWRDANDVYMGVLPRVHGGGKAADLRLAAWVWVDLDAGSETYNEAVALLMAQTTTERIPTPHLLVGSGGGLHAYWRLAAPEPVQTRQEQERLQDVLKRLVLLLGGEPDKAHACPAATDAARILRLPGSFNRKLETPRPVRLLRCEADKAACRSLAWWEGSLPMPRRFVPRPRPARFDSTEGETLAPATIAKLTMPAPNGRKHYEMVEVATACRKRGLDEAATRIFTEQKGAVSGVPMSDPEQQRHLDKIVDWAIRTVQPDYRFSR